MTLSILCATILAWGLTSRLVLALSCFYVMSLCGLIYLPLSISLWSKLGKSDNSLGLGRHLYKIRRFLVVLCLQQHYNEPEDLKAFVQAYGYTKEARRFPVLMRNIFTILVQRHFQGVELQSLADLRVGTVCLTPRCVCLYRRSREEFRSASMTVAVRGRPLQCNVPEWVAYSLLTREHAREQAQMRPIDVALRYEVVPQPRQRLELQGLTMYQHHLVQCVTSRLVPLVHSAAQIALTAASDFLQALIDSYDEYWGTVGVPHNLTDLYSEMSLCWRFKDMITGKKRPIEESYRAMLSLLERFKPKLESFLWPDPQDFPYVARAWPDERQARRQYLVFWTIVRTRSYEYDDWLSVKACTVGFVNPPRVLVRILSLCFRGAAHGDTLLCLSDLVWRMLRSNLA